MKIAELRKLIQGAKDAGVLPMKELDDILLDDRTFERNLNEMLKQMPDVPIGADDGAEPGQHD